MRYLIILSVLIVVTLLQSSISTVNFASANDTIVEITPQGLTFKREERISIEEENLHISLRKIVVSYIFRNNSGDDIVAEVAFPVPPYHINDLGTGNYSHSPLNFNDFSVEVNKTPIAHKKDIRALVDGNEYTSVLQEMGISIEDFGKYAIDDPKKANDLSKVSAKDRKTLVELGLLTLPEEMPNWTVEMKYHWEQTFPANSILAVKHSYTPYFGGEYQMFHAADGEVFGEINREIAKESCLDPKTKANLERKMSAKATETQKEVPLHFSWVAYILTTANNWRKPIKNFNLQIERPGNSVVSLCFDNTLVKTSPTRFESHIQNFIPEKDLKVYFIGESSPFDREDQLLGK